MANRKNNLRRGAVVARQGRRCAWCKVRCNDREPGPDNPTGLTLDHIVPRSRGGANGCSNLQVMCWSCNQTKGDGGCVPGAYRLGEVIAPALRRRMFEMASHPKAARWAEGD